jgi:hypothetical protein
LSANRRKAKAMQIGMLEIVYGSVLVVTIIAGNYAGF